jgi:hypothetical protein
MYVTDMKSTKTEVVMNISVLIFMFLNSLRKNATMII